VRISVLEGERAKAKDCDFKGEFVLRLLTSSFGETSIDITFDLDANGILHVSASERDSDNIESKRFGNHSTKYTIEQMVNDAEKCRNEDASFLDSISLTDIRSLPYCEDEKKHLESNIKSSNPIESVWKQLLLNHPLNKSQINDMKSIFLGALISSQNEYFKWDNLIKVLNIKHEDFVTITKKMGLNSYGKEGYAELARLILVYIALVILCRQTLNQAASPEWVHSQASCHGWARQTENTYPLWYSNLELSRSLAQLMTNIDDAVKEIYCPSAPSASYMSINASAMMQQQSYMHTNVSDID